MIESVTIRVRELLELKNYSVYALAKDGGFNQKTIGDQVKGSAKIGVSTLCFLLSKFPDVSAEWLMRGVGSMISSIASVQNNAYGGQQNINAGNGAQNVDAHAHEYIKDIYEAQLAAKDAIIAEKNERIAELKDTISILKNK